MVQLDLPWDEIVDTRDVLTRHDELVALRDSEDVTDRDEFEDCADEFALLEALIVDLNDCCSGWADGESLIRDSYFKDYARELHEDTADPDVAKIMDQWPYHHIDWDDAADELRQDYTAVEIPGGHFGPVTYWIRSY
jgi:hypothetical protein